jgi:hypothetical protein
MNCGTGRAVMSRLAGKIHFYEEARPLKLEMDAARARG